MFFERKPVDGRFVLELSAVAILIVMGLRIPALNLAALVLCGWMILIEREPDHIFDLLFFLIPLSPIFKLDLRGFALFNLVTIMVLARMLISNGFTFIFAGTAGFVMIVYVLAGFRNAEMSSCVRFICQLLIGSMVMGDARLRNSLSAKRKNSMLAAGIVVSSVTALMRDTFPRLDRYLAEAEATILLGRDSYYYRFMGVETNCNMYTVLLSVSLAVFAVYLIKGRANRLDLALMLVLIVFGCMTASMSFILSALLLAALTVFFMARRNPQVLILSLAIGGAALIVLYKLFGDSDALQTILLRFRKLASGGASVSSVTTGRSDLWGMYIRYFRQHPLEALVGRGLNAALPGRSPHNYYIETVYYLGLAGGILYIVSLIQIYAPSRYTHRRCELYQQLPLMMLLIRGMARCLICEEKLLCIFMIYALCAIDTSQPGRIQAAPA